VRGLQPPDGLIDPALKLMIDAVHRYGGYIVQSTGDGIFGLADAGTRADGIDRNQ
jgi:class 3 adenylate cyclase